MGRGKQRPYQDLQGEIKRDTRSDMDPVHAPLQVPIEIVALDDTGDGQPKRRFRLTRSLAIDGVLLRVPVDLEPGRPVQVNFQLPPPLGDWIHEVGILKEPTRDDPEAETWQGGG